MIDERRARKYCCEDISKIENYELAVADNTQTWECHHRLEIQDGVLIFTPQELIDIGRYWNVPAEELIFLTPSEHRSLHNRTRSPVSEKNPMFGRHHTDEAKEKNRQSHLGKESGMKGKHHSVESVEKMRQANLGKKHSAEAKEKIHQAQLGKHWWNNGQTSKFAKECPGAGFARGRLPSQLKQSAKF